MLDPSVPNDCAFCSDPARRHVRPHRLRHARRGAPQCARALAALVSPIPLLSYNNTINTHHHVPARRRFFCHLESTNFPVFCFTCIIYVHLPDPETPRKFDQKSRKAHTLLPASCACCPRHGPGTRPYFCRNMYQKPTLQGHTHALVPRLPWKASGCVSLFWCHRIMFPH